jgi:hypothetical protein
MNTAQPVPAWEVSEQLLSALDQRIIDTFCRIYQPTFSREGERWVLTIPAAHNGGVHESWASSPAQSLAEFITAISQHKASHPAQEAA